MATKASLNLKSEFALPQTLSRLFHLVLIIRQMLANFFGVEFYLKYKRSVVRTLFLRAETIITDDKDKEIELKHLKSVLQDNSYKPWMFSIPPKTANTSGTKSEVVSTRAQSFSLPHLQGVFRKLAHKRFQKARSWHIPQAFQDHQVTVGPPQRSDTQGKEMWDGVRNSVWGLWWFLS